MKKLIFVLIISCLFAFISCEPRIDLDEGAWGDHAFIENVELYELEVRDSVKLQEWFENETVVTGVRQVIISQSTTIDNETFTANVKVASDQDLSRIIIKFWHKATLIEPLDGAPKAGIVNDFSAGSYNYRLHSADGTIHDWTINIVN